MVSETETINTHTFTDLEPGETYKIIIDAEMEVNGVNIKSAEVEVEKMLCKLGEMFYVVDLSTIV